MSNKADIMAATNISLWVVHFDLNGLFYESIKV